MGVSERYALFGVEGSYYAAKLRSYLLQKNIPFDEIQCDRRVFDEIILPGVGYPVVPVLKTPQGEIMQDTAVIIDELERRHAMPSLLPRRPCRRLAAYLMEFYADEWLKLPALHYRWHYDYEFAHLMMGRNNDPQASEDKQRRVGEKIAAEFRSWPEHLGVTQATRAAVEASFLECLELLQIHYSNHDFAFGAQPTLADCALMGPLYAHLYRDPHSGRIVRERAPAVCDWIDRMRASGTHRVSSDDREDELPETIVPVFKHLSADCVPAMTAAMPLIQQWLKCQQDEAIPRYVGTHEITIGRGKAYASRGPRSLHPIEQWKLQRLQAAFMAHDAQQQRAITACFEDLGASALLNLKFPHRITRNKFRLVRASA